MWVAIVRVGGNSLVLVGAANITYYPGALYFFRTRTPQQAGTNQPGQGHMPN
jgi:hypothetical protein